MKKHLLACVFALVAGSMGLCGCSDDKKPAEAVPEKGVIKEMTDQAAHEMVDHMQRPINRARDVKGQVEGQQEKTYQDE